MGTDENQGKLKRVSNRYSSLRLLQVVVFLACCMPVVAQPTPAPEAGLTVTEWVILICDPNVPQANSSILVQSTLPDFVVSRRTPAAPEKLKELMPIGVIRMSGEAADERVDVLLETKNGRFLSQWPKGQQRSTGQLWQNLEPKAEKPVLEAIPAGHWFGMLREPAGVFWTRDGKGERFILHDTELDYPLPLRIKTAGDQFELLNNGPVSLRDVTLYESKADGWHTVTLAELKPTTKPSTTKPTTKSTTKPTTIRATKAAESSSPRPAATTHTITLATTQITMQAAMQAVSQPATQGTAAGASTRPVVKIAMGSKATPDSHVLVGAWTDRLAAAGLPATDFDLIRSILEKRALDPKRLTAIYRLEPSELDRMLPLEVTPQPKKIVRVGLVIALNIDPALGDEVDQLIAQLGNDDWKKREAAHKQLATLGLAAKPKLEAATKNKDLEIVYRAERLIQALTPVQTPGQPDGQNK